MGATIGVLVLVVPPPDLAHPPLRLSEGLVPALAGAGFGALAGHRLALMISAQVRPGGWGGKREDA